MPTVTLYGAGTQTRYGSWYNSGASAGQPNGVYERLLGSGPGMIGWTQTWDAGQGVVVTGVELTVWVDSPDSRSVTGRVTLNGFTSRQASIACPSGASVRTVSWDDLSMWAQYITVEQLLMDIADSPAGFGVDAFRVILTYVPAYEYPSAADSGTISSAESVTAQPSTAADALDAGTVTGDDQLAVTWRWDLADAGTVTAAESATAAITAPYSDTGTVSAAETVNAAQVQNPADDAGTLSAADVSTRLIRPGWQALRLRAVCRDAGGAVVADLRSVIAAKYQLALSRIGSWQVSVPAEDAVGLSLATVRTVDLYREGEGLVVSGVLDAVELRVGDSGEVVVQLSGQTRARELVLPTIVSYTATGVSLASVVSALITPHGWTLGACPSRTVTVTLAGVSPWQAVAQLAERVGATVRENPLTRTIDLVTGATPSGLAYRNSAPPPDDGYATLLPVLGAQAVVDGTGITTRVIPLAETVAGRTARLQNSTRTSPYTIQSALAEDGSTYYYLQHPAASQYGVRAVVQTWKGIAPLDDTSAEAERAANDLYDAAASWLTARAQPVLRLSIDPAPTFHVSSGGAYRLLPGQTVEAGIRAAVTLEDGTREAVLDVAQSLYVISIERTFGPAGDDRWRLETADMPVPPQDDIDQLAIALSALQVVQLGVIGGGTGGSSGVRTIWDTVIEASLRGDLGTPWW